MKHTHSIFLDQKVQNRTKLPNSNPYVVFDVERSFDPAPYIYLSNKRYPLANFRTPISPSLYILLFFRDYNLCNNKMFRTREGGRATTSHARCTLGGSQWLDGFTIGKFGLFTSGVLIINIHKWPEKEIVLLPPMHGEEDSMNT